MDRKESTTSYTVRGPPSLVLLALQTLRSGRRSAVSSVLISARFGETGYEKKVLSFIEKKYTGMKLKIFIF